jgi:ribose transport system permease protein
LVRRAEKGKTEKVIDNLPGFPDNINLASDGNYWLALVGMRVPRWISPGSMPGFRTPHGQAGADRRVVVSRTSTPAAC